MPNEAIRNLISQAPSLANISFHHRDFRYYTKEEFQNHLFYCDIPYQGTTEYENDGFPYEDFYDWARDMATHNTILVSEYDMPSDFKAVWSMTHKTLISSTKSVDTLSTDRVEKLFVVGNPPKFPSLLDLFFL